MIPILSWENTKFEEMFKGIFEDMFKDATIDIPFKKSIDDELNEI